MARHAAHGGWYVATCGGEYVEESRDLDGLVGIVREIIDPDGPDVVISLGGGVAAIVWGDGTCHRLGADGQWTCEAAPAAGCEHRPGGGGGCPVCEG